MPRARHPLGGHATGSLSGFRAAAVASLGLHAAVLAAYAFVSGGHLVAAPLVEEKPIFVTVVEEPQPAPAADPSPAETDPAPPDEATAPLAAKPAPEPVTPPEPAPALPDIPDPVDDAEPPRDVPAPPTVSALGAVALPVKRPPPKASRPAPTREAPDATAVASPLPPVRTPRHRHAMVARLAKEVAVRPAVPARGHVGATAGAPRTAPRYLYNPAPPYPRAEQRRGREGVVLLRVRVAADGRIASVAILRSSGVAAFDTAALRAVRTWRFRPATDGGKPIDGVAEVPVRFSLSG